MNLEERRLENREVIVVRGGGNGERLRWWRWEVIGEFEVEEGNDLILRILVLVIWVV